MDESQRKGMSMVLVLVISAIFCASATFIAILLLTNRNAAEDTGSSALPQRVIIGDQVIVLKTDPEKAVFLPAKTVEAIPEREQVEQAQQAGTPTLEAATQQPATPTRTPDPLIFVSYVVQSGDTLYSLTRIHNTSIELMAVHGIGGDDMVAGTTLSVPVANPAFCPGMRAYVVRENDTVFSIARAYGSSPEAITAANNLVPGALIYTTNVLCIP